MDKKKAESLGRLREHPDGNAYLRELAKDFDEAIRLMLYAESDQVLSAQGKARALHEQLKKFDDAEKALRR